MGDTGGPIRRPEPTAACPAMATLRDTYYRPLVRLAALLTGDADLAEAVAGDALAALESRPALRAASSGEDVLRYLQHQVLLRSRRSRRPRAAPLPGRNGRRRARHSEQPTSGGATALRPSLEFGGLAVVLALRDLPSREREAVVLTHYLDLAQQQAAAIAGVTEAALRQRLDKAMRTLQVRLPQA